LVYEDGDQILKSAQKKLKLKEDFRFKDMEDNPVLRVTTDNVLDIAATYTVTDEQENEAIGAVKEEISFLQHEWKILDTEGNIIADITEDNVAMALVRRFVTTLLPFSYVIESDNQLLGTIKGKFSLRDTYDIELSEKEDLNPRLAVVATVLIDAMESN
jgi:uncharacterized protein YxjI